MSSEPPKFQLGLMLGLATAASVLASILGTIIFLIWELITSDGSSNTSGESILILLGLVCFMMSIFLGFPTLVFIFAPFTWMYREKIAHHPLVFVPFLTGIGAFGGLVFITLGESSASGTFVNAAIIYGSAYGAVWALVVWRVAGPLSLRPRGLLNEPNDLEVR